MTYEKRVRPPRNAAEFVKAMRGMGATVSLQDDRVVCTLKGNHLDTVEKWAADKPQTWRDELRAILEEEEEDQ